MTTGRSPTERARRRLLGLRDAIAIRTGILRRPRPLHRDFGFHVGWPVDRHYIEGFLAAHRTDVRGEVLECGNDPNYTREFGDNRVTRAHVLYPVAGLPGGTLVGDLAIGEGIPQAAFDCMILTQVLQMIYDIRGAVRTVHASLREGGVALVTISGISQVSIHEPDAWGEHWRVTERAARRLFEEAFGTGAVTVESYGNVLAACAFLHGVPAAELTRAELDHRDPEFPVIVAVRAVKRTA
jgi:hypothetical protein